jgi:CheY-like chemotaxis protein
VLISPGSLYDPCAGGARTGDQFGQVWQPVGPRRDGAGRLARTAFGDLAIGWREAGGPPVTAPTRQGFGSTIITRSIPHELQGEADVRYRLPGWRPIFLSRRAISPRFRPQAQAALPRPVSRQTACPAKPRQSAGDHPARVLVVEDSIIIALDTEENLKRLGVPEVRLESSVTGALEAIAASPPDFAIIDFNLGGESSEPVAAGLARCAACGSCWRQGYAESASEMDTLGAAGVLRKPYGRSELERALGLQT